MRAIGRAGRTAALGTGAACLLLLALGSQLTQRPARGTELLLADEVAGRAVAWGRLDCYNRGAYYESAALGCSQAGGCDVWGRAHVRPSFVPECGATSDICVEHFKTCLMEKHAYTRRPVPTQCDCYPDTVSIGCSPACVDSIFQSYGELSERCYNFNAYEGCLYIDGYRLPAERYMDVAQSAYSSGQRPQLAQAPSSDVSSLKSKKSKSKKSKESKGKKETKEKKNKTGPEVPAAAPPTKDPAAVVKPTTPPAAVSLKKTKKQTLEDEDLDLSLPFEDEEFVDPALPFDFDLPDDVGDVPEIDADAPEIEGDAPEIDAVQDEEDFPGDFWTPPADLSAAEPQYIFEAQPNYLDYENVPERGLEPAEYLSRFEGAPAGLQRQPGGTYVQKDNRNTLIEPWQIQKDSYDQRWDQEWFDDDDPRE